MKILLWIVIIAIVIGGGWFIVRHLSNRSLNVTQIPSVVSNQQNTTSSSRTACDYLTPADIASVLNLNVSSGKLGQTIGAGSICVYDDQQSGAPDVSLEATVVNKNFSVASFNSLNSNAATYSGGKPESVSGIGDSAFVIGDDQHLSSSSIASVNFLKNGIMVTLTINGRFQKSYAESLARIVASKI